MVNFTNFFRVAFQQNSSGQLLIKLREIQEHWCSLFLFYENITQKNYLIIFEHVDKLSRKNIYLKKILDLGYKFGLCEPPFTGFGLEISWTAIYNYTYYILY